jgi:WD40 repeat protein
MGQIAFGPAGRLLAAAGEVTGGMKVIVWDTDSGEEVASLPGIARFAFAPDGEHLLAVRGGGVMTEPGARGQILVWKLGAPEPVHTIAAFQSTEQQTAGDVAALATSPNGRFLIAVSDAGDVEVWDLDGGT